MINGRNMPFWKKRLNANSLRVSFLDANIVISVRSKATTEKRSHHIGNFHQSGKADGEKFEIILEKMILGKAISIANIARK